MLQIRLRASRRRLLARLGLPVPWQGTLEASLRLIDELDREIGDCERDLRGPLAKQGPRYLRWALVEAATHACTAPYRDPYQRTKARIGK
jgi:hypothetical protein